MRPTVVRWTPTRHSCGPGPRSWGIPKEDHETAERFYRQAIRLDSAFTRAYSGLALVHAADYRHQWVDDRKAALRLAEEMAEAAVQIDPKIPEAHWVLAYVSAQLRRHDEALTHLDKALAVSPGFADAIALKGGINTYIGEPAASVSLVRAAMALKPSPGYLYFLALGRAYFFLGDFGQAGVNLRAALARNPASLEAHLYLAAALWNSGDVEGAAWEAEEVRSLEPGFSCRAWIETYPMTDVHQTEALVSALDSVDL